MSDRVDVEAHSQACACVRFTLAPADDAERMAAMRPADVLLDEYAGGTLIVDVTHWDGTADAATFSTLGEPVFVCFGTHPVDACPLTHGCVPWEGLHGITLEIAGSVADHVRLARRFRELVRSDRIIRVLDRTARTA